MDLSYRQNVIVQLWAYSPNLYTTGKQIIYIFNNMIAYIGFEMR